MAPKAQKGQTPGGSSPVLTVVIIILAVLLLASVTFICVMLFGKGNGGLDRKTKKLYNTVVMTVGDEKVTYETYRYYFLTGMTQYDLGDKSYWQTAQGAESLKQLREDILSELRYRAAVRAICKQYGITLTDAEEKELEDYIANLESQLQSVGSDMNQALAARYMTRNYFTETTRYETLADKLYTFLTDKNAGYIDYSDEAAGSFSKDFFHVKHILYGFSDSLTEEEAKAKAEETIAALAATQNEEERLAKFDELMAEGSNDYQKDGDNFYYYTHGEMDEAFEAAVDTLAEGEISSPVKSSYGWHVILRLPIDLSYFKENVYASYKFSSIVEEFGDKLQVTTTDFYDSLTPDNAQ